jgi:alpha-tubulin suppressor-like RCC1 family protein
MITITAAIVFASVSAGTHHTCGLITSGVGYCWGDNSSGQLGNGTTTNSTTPVPVSGGYSFAMISAGGSHTCGITSFLSGSPVGGTLYCWGDNTYGQLGNGMMTSSATPVPVSVSSTLSFIFATAGGSHTCGMALPISNPAYGGVGYCWGDNSSGQLGNGTFTNSSVPVAIWKIPPLESGPAILILGWVNLSAGNNHTCGNAVQVGGADGAGTFGYCWGDNSSGEVDDGTTTNRAVPAVGEFTETVSSGTLFSCTLDSCWGNNSVGQLGDGAMTNSKVPLQISGAFNPPGNHPGTVEYDLFGMVSAGGDHACAVTSAGVPGAPPQVGGIGYCWGGNSSGQLGNGTMTNSTTPIVVVGGLTFETISAGGSHNCGVTMTNPPSPIGGGAVYCWGDNTFGQLGNGTTINSATPVPVNAAGPQ